MEATTVRKIGLAIVLALLLAIPGIILTGQSYAANGTGTGSSVDTSDLTTSKSESCRRLVRSSVVSQLVRSCP